MMKTTSALAALMMVAVACNKQNAASGSGGGSATAVAGSASGSGSAKGARSATAGTVSAGTVAAGTASAGTAAAGTAAAGTAAAGTAAAGTAAADEPGGSAKPPKPVAPDALLARLIGAIKLEAAQRKKLVALMATWKGKPATAANQSAVKAALAKILRDNQLAAYHLIADEMAKSAH